MSSVETGQMFAVEIGWMSAAQTRQMSNVQRLHMLYGGAYFLGCQTWVIHGTINFSQLALQRRVLF